MVSYKMWMELHEGNKPTMNHSYVHGKKAVAQAVVNAAWCGFDPDDESTWPNSTLAPSGHKWFVEWRWSKIRERRTIMSAWLAEHFYSIMEVEDKRGVPTIVRYVDPADLMYKEIGKC